MRLLILGRRLCRSDFIKRRTKPFGKRLWLVFFPEVHEEKPRLLGEHVIMQSRDTETERLERTQHRVDLGGKHHEISIRDGAPALDRLKAQGNRRPHGRWYSKPINVNSFLPRYRNLEYALANCAFMAEDTFQGLDIERKISRLGCSISPGRERLAGTGQRITEALRKFDRPTDRAHMQKLHSTKAWVNPAFANKIRGMRVWQSLN